MRAQRQQLMRAELLANLVEAIAMLDDPPAEEIGRLAKVKLSVAPIAEPGADPAAVVALPTTEALAATARALQAEAARWARLKPGKNSYTSGGRPCPARCVRCALRRGRVTRTIAATRVAWVAWLPETYPVMSDDLDRVNQASPPRPTASRNPAIPSSGMTAPAIRLANPAKPQVAA